jgi:hypothetical protein
VIDVPSNGGTCIRRNTATVGSASTAGGAGSRMWFYARSTIPEKRVSSTELILICLSFRSHRPYLSKRLKTHSLILRLFSDTSGVSSAKLVQQDQGSRQLRVEPR